jgi:hypothetical protein
MGGILNSLEKNVLRARQQAVAWIGAVRASRRVSMKQRGELAYEPDAESDQDDADEGMRSDTEANTEQEANGTGDTDEGEGGKRAETEARGRGNRRR